jgi:hypothetical protein
VNPHLVRPARLEATFNQRTAIHFSLQRIMRNRVFATRGFLGQHSHFLAVGIGPADPAADRSRARLRMPVAHREIGPFERMVGELPGKPFMRRVALGDHQQSRGVLVDPVHDPGTGDAADARRFPLQ